MIIIDTCTEKFRAEPQNPDKKQLTQELLPYPMRVQIAGLLSYKSKINAANTENSDWFQVYQPSTGYPSPHSPLVSWIQRQDVVSHQLVNEQKFGKCKMADSDFDFFLKNPKYPLGNPPFCLWNHQKWFWAPK